MFCVQNRIFANMKQKLTVLPVPVSIKKKQNRIREKTTNIKKEITWK